jgi:hypothetical protein
VQNHALLPSAFVVGRQVEYAGSHRISFREIPQVGAREFPGTFRDRDVVLHLFEAHRGEPERKLAKLQLGDPAADLPYLVDGLHGPEGNRANRESLYRWTTGRAELQLPRAGRARLLVEPRWRPREVAPNYRIRVDGADAPFQLVEAPGGRTFIDVKISNGPRARATMLLELECEPFSPSDRGTSRDARRLGVPLFSVELGD